MGSRCLDPPQAPLLGSLLGGENLQRSVSTVLPGGQPHRGQVWELRATKEGSQRRGHPVLRRQQMVAQRGAQQWQGGDIWVSGVQPSYGSMGVG